MTRPRNPVQLAIVGTAHGIRGEVRVKPFTEDPLALADYGPLYTHDGRPLTIAAIRPAKGVVIVRFDGIADRNAAETLAGEALFVDRSALPAELEEEEFYHADLVGLRVLDEADAEHGTVVAIHNFGAGDILEIRPASGPTRMIPFTRAAVPAIDFGNGTIRIDREAAGFDTEEGQTGETMQPSARGRKTGSGR